THVPRLVPGRVGRLSQAAHRTRQYQGSNLITHSSSSVAPTSTPSKSGDSFFSLSFAFSRISGVISKVSGSGDLRGVALPISREAARSALAFAFLLASAIAISRARSFAYSFAI